MKELESNIPREQPEKKGFGSSPKSEYNDREVLNNELREAISKITERNKVRNKNSDLNVG